MWKLLSFRSPLKVLIFYDYREDSKTGKAKKEWLDGKLRQLFEIGRAAGRAWLEAVNVEYIFIIGNRSEDGHAPRWRYCVVERGGLSVTEGTVFDHWFEQRMRYERLSGLLRLAIWLQGSHGGVTLADIREEFSVSRRTAERMRDAVRATFGPLDPSGHRHGRSANSLAASFAPCTLLSRSRPRTWPISKRMRELQRKHGVPFVFCDRDVFRRLLARGFLRRS